MRPVRDWLDVELEEHWVLGYVIVVLLTIRVLTALDDERLGHGMAGLDGIDEGSEFFDALGVLEFASELADCFCECIEFPPVIVDTDFLVG